jgi:hypothetical protein
MKAIGTKYHGPTNARGASITASELDGTRRVTIDYPHELSGQDVHQAAADALCARLHWTGRLVGAPTKGGGYVFILIPADGNF